VNVAGGVLEPGYVVVVAAENPLLVRIESAFVTHSTLSQLINGLVDVVDRKIKNGE
jgi:hypothetical protein